MEPRLTLITLGVADVSKAQRFYEALGFVASSASEPGVAFFKAGGIVLALYGRTHLAADASIADGGASFSGISLAHNTRSEAEVDRVLAEAVRCGATLVKPAAKTFWGGYCGYFSDPDGHLWEVAYNPAWPLDGAGAIELP
jgi:predicted lactoylglutathione lyase